MSAALLCLQEISLTGFLLGAYSSLKVCIVGDSMLVYAHAAFALSQVHCMNEMKWDESFRKMRAACCYAQGTLNTIQCVSTHFTSFTN